MIKFLLVVSIVFLIVLYSCIKAGADAEKRDRHIFEVYFEKNKDD